MRISDGVQTCALPIYDDVLVIEGGIAERDRPPRVGFEGQLAFRPVGDAAVAAVAIVEIEFGEHAAHAEFRPGEQIGRAWGRERVCQGVWISVDAESLKNKNRGVRLTEK